jgi:hypothetical protein
MSRLKEIWKRQLEQQIGFNMDPEAMTKVRKIEVAKDLLLGLDEEVAKLANSATHYKVHILRSTEIEKANVAEAVVDVLKYAIAIGQLYGLTDTDLYDTFLNKSTVVADKARGERLLLERDTRVILFDLDNVIADMLDWDIGLKKARGQAMDGMGDVMVTMLESMKEEFYKSNGFLKLSPVDSAPESIRLLKSYGWKIVIISARPIWQYRHIYSDTVQWLNKHGIEYDLLLFNKDKAEAIYEHIFPAMPSYLVEDREKHVLEVSELGIKVLVMDYSYNETIKDTNLITRVYGWNEVISVIGRP